METLSHKIRTRLLVLGLLLAAHATTAPASASAQNMFYGFEGDGWLQAFDELTTFGNASVEMNRGTAFQGRNNVALHVTPTDSGFRKALPPVQQGKRSCTLSFFYTASTNGLLRISSYIADAATGQILLQSATGPQGGSFNHGWMEWRGGAIQSLPIGRKMIFSMSVAAADGGASGWLRADNLRFDCY